MANFPDTIVVAPSVCPCKDCQERTPTCHGGCKKYNEWQENRKKAISKRRK